MIETVWIAFGCGTIIGVILGGLSMGLWTLQSAEAKNDEIDRLRTTRHLLKEEIFRLEKNYKPRKPQPRKKRYKKNYHDFVNNFKDRVKGDSGEYYRNDITYNWLNELQGYTFRSDINNYKDRKYLLRAPIRQIKEVIDNGRVDNY